MKTYHFECTLLSEVIISSSAATEGQNRSLDYLPGSKFMGIVASQLYGNDELDTWRVFHSGKVKFGNAYLLNTIPVPFDWFKPKGSSSKIYLNHQLSQAEREEMRTEGVQLKQVRNGSLDLASSTIISISQDFRLKSAYDAEKRKSKDEQMYGYFSLPQNSRWNFTVTDLTSEYQDFIVKYLSGLKRIGRSKTAEYGLVNIKFLKTTDVEETSKVTGDFLVYAKSDICCIDDAGDYTTTPDGESLLQLKGVQIDWAKSQVRTKIIQNWNGKRGARDIDRTVIEKGSVFYISNSGEKTVGNFCGVNQTEGYGSVLINPDFLKEKEISDRTILYDEFLYTPTYADVDEIGSTNLVKLISRRSARISSDVNLSQEVYEFRKEYELKFKSVKKSQWGTLRAYSKQFLSLDSLILTVFGTSHFEGFLDKGKSKEQWAASKETLKDKLNSLKDDPKKGSGYALDFFKKLTIEMPKI